MRTARINICLCTLVVAYNSSLGQTNADNYVKSAKATSPVTGSLFSVDDPDLMMTVINYYDGLGRPIQTVTKKGSPQYHDVVQPIVYDLFGRQVKNYLPFTNGADGLIKVNPIGTTPENYTASTQYTYYYGNGDADKIADDTRPFSETSFEVSELGRPLKNLGPGSDWNSHDKFVSHQYLLNKYGTDTGQEKIIAWLFDEATGLPVKSSSSNTTYVVGGGYYASGQLSIKVTVDEKGNAVREYTDKLGHTILKKVQAVEGSTDLNNIDQWASTYYVYDDFGNLVVVLPPEAVKMLLSQ